MDNNRAGYRIYSVKGRWHVRGNGIDVPYVDGLTLPRDAGTKKVEKAVSVEDKTLKQIDAFIAKVKKLDALPMPNGGDCWLCLMFNQNQQPRAMCHDPEHLRSHLKDGYIHGSLIVSALKWAGVPDAGIGFWMQQFKPRVVSTLRKYLKAQLGVGAV
jgi:hypothetical protein